MRKMPRLHQELLAFREGAHSMHLEGLDTTHSNQNGSGIITGSVALE